MVGFELVEEINREFTLLANLQKVLQLDLHLPNRNLKLFKSPAQMFQIKIDIQVNDELKDLHAFLLAADHEDDLWLLGLLGYLLVVYVGFGLD